MKGASILIAAGLAGLASATSTCNANNCARQITGTRAKTPNLAVRQTDCANFMTTTVYATPTATTTPAPIFNKRRRDVAKRGAVTVSGTVPAYATDCTGVADYSSACSCWGYTAKVITIATPTTTVAAATPTCHPGLQWGYFPFTEASGDTSSPGQLPYNSESPYAQEYDPIVFQGQEPSTTGVTGQTGGITDYGACGTDLDVWGTDVANPGYIGIEQRGYFIPQNTGAYTFTGDADEIVLVWVGLSTGFTVANALLVVSDGQGAASATFTPTAAQVGVPLPFRVQWANAQGCATFDLQVTDSSNNIVLGPGVQPNDIFVQYCDNDSAAPAYPDWQSESL